MTPRWIRNRPGPRENLEAAGAALALGGLVAALVFYVLRIVLARDEIRPPGALVGRGEGPGEGPARLEERGGGASDGEREALAAGAEEDGRDGRGATR